MFRDSLPPGTPYSRQPSFQVGRFLSGCGRGQVRFKQFGQELVRAIALSLEVGSMATGNDPHLRQIGLQGRDMVLQGGDHGVTGLVLGRPRNGRMVYFGEIDLDQRFSVIRARAGQSMPLHQRPCRFRRDLEPVAEFGVSQHFHGHDLRSVQPAGDHPDLANASKAELRIGLL
jgi:hypothetical protein